MKRESKLGDIITTRYPISGTNVLPIYTHTSIYYHKHTRKGNFNLLIDRFITTKEILNIVTLILDVIKHHFFRNDIYLNLQRSYVTSNNKNFKAILKE